MFHKFGLEIIEIVVFHLMIESFQIFGFFSNFWDSVPDSKSDIKRSPFVRFCVLEKDGLT